MGKEEAEILEKSFQRFIALKVREGDRDTVMSAEARELLAAGLPVFYSPAEFPGETVKEYPDGRREIVALDQNHNEYVVRELPKAGRDHGAA